MLMLVCAAAAAGAAAGAAGAAAVQSLTPMNDNEWVGWEPVGVSSSYPRS
jgi:hypothetical protein